jgi:hypothetical protein
MSKCLNVNINLLINRYLLILIITIFICSCDNRNAEPVYTGLDYFPVEQGNWIIYDVDSTVYDDFLGEVFNFKYQVKEVQELIFTGDSGEETMRLERFWRRNDDDNWGIKNVWTARIHDQRALKTEENITYVKLSFPVKNNKSWDGNAFNSRSSQPYRITDIHQQRQYGELLFDSTLRVLQKEFITLIGEEFQYEVYGHGIGLIEKHYTELQKEIDGTIRRGVIYSYTVKDYGKFLPNK